MKKFRQGFYLLIVMMAFSTGFLHAQYWFQFGARADPATSGNNGASAVIQTISPQNGISDGSLGFWVGEDLSDGSFVQVGYLVENQTGYYPTSCTLSGCDQTVFLTAGDAEWFYEYFVAGVNSGFLGEVGPDGSAGVNGTFDNYSFYSDGDKWFFKVNGDIVGSVIMHAADSGSNLPVAFGEVANTSTNSQYVDDVEFYNFSFYKSGRWALVSSGDSYSGYGVGSLQNLPSKYSVEELDNRTNYFIVGSGLPSISNYESLWNSGYELRVISQFGDINSSRVYNTYSVVTISAPDMVQLSNNSRAEFYEWFGSGIGSYTGSLTSTEVVIEGNITENAEWAKQYFVDVSSDYGYVVGSGWYDNGSTATYSISNSTVYVNSAQREVFEGWSNGNLNANGSAEVSGPQTISAIWKTEYYINGTSDFNAVNGSGWYAQGSVAKLALSNSTHYVNSGERYVFANWTNGENDSVISFGVNGPVSEHANFEEQYLVKFVAQNNYSQNINVQEFELGNTTFENQTFLDKGKNYTLTGVLYDGVDVRTRTNIQAESASILNVRLPVYNEQIYTSDLFFRFPVNALVTVYFANHTSESVYTGENGSVLFQNIPYGYVNGTVSSFIKQDIESQPGANLEVSVFSLLDLIVLLIVFLVIIGTYIEFRDKTKRK